MTHALCGDENSRCRCTEPAGHASGVHKCRQNSAVTGVCRGEWEYHGGERRIVIYPFGGSSEEEALTAALEAGWIPTALATTIRGGIRYGVPATINAEDKAGGGSD